MQRALDCHGQYAHYETLYQYLKKGDIRNIRIIRRIRSTTDAILVAYGSQEQAAVEAIAMQCVLLTWAYNSKDTTGPRYEFVKTYSYVQQAGLAVRGVEAPPEDVRDTEILRRFDFDGMDDVGAEISFFLENGFCDADRVVSAIKKYENSADVRSKKSAFNDAWEKLNNSFLDDEEYIVSTWLKSCTAETAGASELDATVTVLRNLGYEQDAEKLIDSWVNEARSAHPEALDRDRFARLNPVRNEDVAGRIDEARALLVRPPSLDETLDRIWRDRLIRAELGAVLISASVNDFVNYLMGQHESLGGKVGACLAQTHQNPEYTAVEERIKEALGQVAKKSKLNAVRVARYQL